jgi:predicted phage-related endonuclease
MSRTIHDLQQGSDAWNAFRLTHFGASEAAAMLGLSRKVKRNELLHMKATGSAKEFSDWAQEHILDKGHEVEALARPNAETIAEEDFYPVTCSDGLISASCDGLNMADTIGFEHKQWNEEYAELVRQSIVPEEHMPQCQQCLMVTGAEKWLFMISDGTKERCVWTWVTPDPEWFNRIRAGWAQFAKDLAVYQPRELAEKPKAEPIMSLPVLNIQIRGEVAMSNLPAYRDAALQFIEQIKTDLQTDEDFSQAEATVKFCDEAEKKLQLAKDQALSQTASIDELLRTIDHIKEAMRRKRLDLAKLVEDKKKSIKETIISEARKAFADHLAGLEKEIAPLRLPVQNQPDFVGAARNKRTLASLHDAVDTALANAKIEVDATAKAIRGRLTWYREHAAGFEFLFADLPQIIGKADEDFVLVVNNRIAVRKQTEADKEAARAKEMAEQAQSAGFAVGGPVANTPQPAPGELPSASIFPSPSLSPLAPAAKRSMPSAAALVSALASFYQVDEATARSWLCAYDFGQLAPNRAAA